MNTALENDEKNNYATT